MSELTTNPPLTSSVRITAPAAFVMSWVFCTLSMAVTGFIQERNGTSEPMGWIILIFGTAAAFLAAGAASLLRRKATWRPAGAVVLAVLAVLTIPFLGWFTALPAYLGVAAAWVGGPLDPEAGIPGRTARIAGVVGMCLAMLAWVIFGVMSVVLSVNAL